MPLCVFSLYFTKTMRGMEVVEFLEFTHFLTVKVHLTPVNKV